MLRMQPIEIVKRDADHCVVRCQTDSGDVEFLFTREYNEDGSCRQMQHQDAFYFVVYDDDGGWELLKSVAWFDGSHSDGLKIFELPEVDCHPVSLCFAERDQNGSNQYVISFKANEDHIEKVFKVSGVKDKRVVEYGSQIWTATRQGIWWDVEGVSKPEKNVLMALVCFDFARTCEYSEELLKERLEKVDWKQIFIQSDLNDQRRAQKEAEKRSVASDASKE